MHKNHTWNASKRNLWICLYKICNRYLWYWNIFKIVFHHFAELRIANDFIPNWCQMSNHVLIQYREVQIAWQMYTDVIGHLVTNFGKCTSTLLQRMSLFFFSSCMGLLSHISLTYAMWSCCEESSSQCHILESKQFRKTEYPRKTNRTDDAFLKEINTLTCS